MKSATSEVHISALEYLGLFNGYMDESKIHVYAPAHVCTRSVIVRSRSFRMP